MTTYNEKTGKTLLTGATDAEGDAIVMFRVGTTLPGGGTGGTATFPATVTLNNPTSAVTTVSVASDGAVTMSDGGDPSSFPANGASNVTLGTFQFTIADDNGAESTVGGAASNGVYTATVTANGVTSVNPNSYVTAGLVLRLAADAGVTASSGVVTQWLDQVSGRVFTPVGSPTLGTPAGGTATATMVIGVNAGFTSSDLTGMPTGAAPRTVQAIWKFDGTVKNFAGPFGWGAAVADQTFTIDIDTAGNLRADYFTNFTSFGITAPAQWMTVTLTYDGTNVAMWLGGVKVLTDARTLNTGSTLINVMRSFSSKTTTGEIGGVLVYGRVLSDSEILQNVAHFKDRFIGAGNPADPAAVTISGAANTDGYTSAGTTSVTYGARAWTTRTSSSTPTEAQLLAGTSALVYGVTVQNNSTAWSHLVTGGAQNTDYYDSVIDYDLTGGKTAVVRSSALHTASSATPAAVLSLVSTGTPTTSGTTISFTSDRVGTFDAVTWDPAAQATPDFASAETWAGAGISPASPAVHVVNDAIGAASTNAYAPSGLLSAKTYGFAIAYRNGTSVPSTILTGTFTTANPPTGGSTLRDQLIGLGTGATPSGRTSVASLKTIGSDGIPAGWNIVTTAGLPSLVATMAGASFSDYLIVDLPVSPNGFANVSVTQSRLTHSGTTTAQAYMVPIPSGSDNFLLQWCDLHSNYGASADSALIAQQPSSTTAYTTATCAMGVQILNNSLKWPGKDFVKLVGGGVLCKRNALFPPAQSNVDITWYDGTPSHYTTGDVVRFDSNHLYTSTCLVANPTIGPVSGGNAQWTAASSGAHTDGFNPYAAIAPTAGGSAVIIEENWGMWDPLDPSAARTFNFNNFLRFIRNNGQPYSYFEVLAKNNYHIQNLGVQIPISLGPANNSTNWNATFRFVGGWYSPRYGGVYVNGTTNLITEWTGVLNRITETPLAQP